MQMYIVYQVIILTFPYE